MICSGATSKCLQEQLRQTRDRFNVGEVTRTDVAQSESRLASGRSQVLLAESNYNASQATYRQVIGSNPGKLLPAAPVDRFSPRTLNGAVGRGTNDHPSVATAQYNVDAAQLAVKVAEGALLPTVSVQGNYQKNYLAVGGLNTIESYNASVLGTLSMPIYQGGAEYSLIRQAKETLAQRRLDLDTARDAVRQQRGAGMGAAPNPPRAISRPRKRRCRPPKSRSTACARKPASASAPPSTCSMLSRSWSMPGWQW